MQKQKLRNINSDNIFLQFVEMSTQINEMCKNNLIIRKRFLLNVPTQSPKYPEKLVFYKIIQGFLRILIEFYTKVRRCTKQNKPNTQQQTPKSGTTSKAFILTLRIL